MRGSPETPRFWLPLLVVALGAASLLVTAGAESLFTRAVRQGDTLLRAVAELRFELLQTHLAIEELTAGKTLPPATIDRRLDRAAQRLAVLRAVAPSSEQERGALEVRLAPLETGIAELRQLEEARLNGFGQGEAVGAGSPIELEYDARLDAVLRAADRLAEWIGRQDAARRHRARLLRTAALVVWGVLLLGVGLALWRHEGQRSAALQALREGERRVAQAQKMEAVGRLAGGVAHDVNNYLAAIRAHCELVAGREQPREQVVRKMELVIDTVARAARLVERLLAFGRRQVTFPERVDLGEVVESFYAMLGGSATGEVRCELELAPDLWPVEMDLAEAEQLVANLFVNARDATPPGGRVRLTTRNRPAGEGAPDRVELEVADSGEGIPRELHDRIFEPFFTTREGSGSSGLGLATVYSIVHGAGGSIEVESAPGAGARFRVLLPRSSRAAVAAAAGDDEELRGEGERLLLVDDQEEVREATRALLASLDYRITAVASVEEALAAAEATPYDLVITDVRLDDGSGPELIARLRRQRPVRALLMSGYTDRVELRAQGAPDPHFVKKPFSAHGLARMVRQLLDRPWSDFASNRELTAPDERLEVEGADVEQSTGTARDLKALGSHGAR